MSGIALIGTAKGAFFIHEDGAESPMLPGWAVNHAVRDPRDGTLYAAANSWTYGGTVQRSRDEGRSWERCGQVALPEESGLTVKATWHVEPGHASEPSTLYLGVDPGALFRSDDGGDSWEPVRGILEHPTRNRWMPGTGGLTCHSIQVARDDPSRTTAASTDPTMRATDDGGSSWRLLEGGLPERAWTGVLREGMSSDAEGAVYFGTQNGSVWVTRDAGEGWAEWARDLPPILSVEAWS